MEVDCVAHDARLVVAKGKHIVEENLGQLRLEEWVANEPARREERCAKRDEVCFGRLCECIRLVSARTISKMDKTTRASKICSPPEEEEHVAYIFKDVLREHFEVDRDLLGQRQLDLGERMLATRVGDSDEPSHDEADEYDGP